MSGERIRDALRATLEDYRLSRGEKRALAHVIESVAPDEHRLAVARHDAFDIAREELIGPDAIAVVNWLEDVVKVLQPKLPDRSADAMSEAYFSPQDNCVNKLEALFAAATESVDVCVFTITDDRIKHAILAAHRRRVSLRILSDNEKSSDLGSDVDELAAAGIPVRVDRSEFHMHHKYALFDRRRLLTGSYNWTRSAATSNQENFLITGDAELVRAYRQAFDQLWDRLK